MTMPWISASSSSLFMVVLRSGPDDARTLGRTFQVARAGGGEKAAELGVNGGVVLALHGDGEAQEAQLQEQRLQDGPQIGLRRGRKGPASAPQHHPIGQEDEENNRRRGGQRDPAPRPATAAEQP